MAYLFELKQPLRYRKGCFCITIYFAKKSYFASHLKTQLIISQNVKTKTYVYYPEATAEAYKSKVQFSFKNFALRNMHQPHEIKFYVVQDSRESKGLAKIYIRFFDGKKKTDYFTGIRWPKSNYDKITEQLLPR